MAQKNEPICWIWCFQSEAQDEIVSFSEACVRLETMIDMEYTGRIMIIDGTCYEVVGQIISRWMKKFSIPQYY